MNLFQREMTVNKNNRSSPGLVRTDYMLLLTAACALVLSASALPTLAQQPAITPAITIDQNKIRSYPLRTILESGGDFHTTPFTPADGHGEGKEGPRARQREALYPGAYPNFPFLRVNGLDSQSCYECHNSIGSYVPPDYKTSALLRKPSPVGGSAGLASNAFINPNFPWQLTMFLRNPPHVFGSGYAQSVGEEMSTQLAVERLAVRLAATALAKQAFRKTGKHTVIEQSIPLEAKGLSFGTLRTRCDETGKCTDDTSGVTGVSSDLIVRPFQWKGIASSVRHFVRDALDFHFSMQAVEKVGHIDCDRDGKIDEMTLGNVTALTAFVAMTRPPSVAIPAGGKASYDRGMAIFTGSASDLKDKLSGRMCATCHEPSLKLERPRLVVADPGPANVTNQAGCPVETLLINPEPPERHDTTKRINAHLASVTSKNDYSGIEDLISPADVHARLKPLVANTAPPTALTDLVISLSNPGSDVPAYVFPRLPVKAGTTSVDVPLFSDLRTHNMGTGLQDTNAQGADVDGIAIPPPLFLTRPLWGVADTGPWLHDGRARTLLEAIMFHASPGSEANGVIAAFEKLSAADQQSVVDFLLAMRLPIAEDVYQGPRVPAAKP